MAYFAIYKTATGELVSDETDDAANRLPDAELTRRGLTRVSMAGPFDAAFTWNAASKQRIARTPNPDETLRATLVTKGAAGTMTAIDQSNASRLLSGVRF